MNPHLLSRTGSPRLSQRTKHWLCRCWARALLLGLAQAGGMASSQAFTFVVLGDNRGDSNGELSPAFKQIVQAVRNTRPRFVLNTGDMIYGHTNGGGTREQWRLYRAAVNAWGVPVHHVPGNHDLWDAESVSLYREVCGPTYWSFTYGSVLFIGLDTESNQSSPGPEQFAWLERQLAHAGARKVFLMLHRPLFPADGGLGSSLDVHPSERDALHRLFVQYRGIIKAVFLGHEHLYHFEERDGVRYYITGGAGANLYEVPELGGFHHFLLVRVTQDDVKIELRKVGTSWSGLRRPVKIAASSLLESWEQGLIWYPWDYTVTAELSQDHATAGSRGLQLNCDLAQCPWPVLSLPLQWVTGWQDAQALAIDAYLPKRSRGEFTIAPALEGTRKFAAPPVRLKPGWNTVRLPLDGTGLPNQERSAVRAVEWGLTAPASQARMSLVFDNLRSESKPPHLPASTEPLESWERTLLWRVVDESVITAPDEGLATDGRRGLKLELDFSKCREPMALARLNPPWDLRKPAAMALDIFVPHELAGQVSARLGLRALEVSHRSPAIPLKQGWNKVRVELNGDWLPKQVRAAAEQIEFRISANGEFPRGWLVLDNLRSEVP
jgi:hypothetical protein